MYVNILRIKIPPGTYRYNGHTYIVAENSIEKSKDFYPNSFETIVKSGNIVHSDSIIVTMQLKGLARTIGIM